MIIFALALGGFSIGTVEFAAMSLVPYFASDLNVDPAAAAHAISAYALGVVIGAPVLAAFGSKFPRKALLITLMGFYASANLAAAFATTYPTFVALRFLAGLPHGAYFGVAALVAASLVPVNKRSWAVSMVMLGLTFATLLGVPGSSFIAQNLTWRFAFGFAAFLAFMTAILVLFLAPNTKSTSPTGAFGELAALGNKQVLLTLSVGAIGFGGLFSVFTYVASTLQEVTRAPDWAEPLMFVIFGAGMVSGTWITGRIADRNLLGTAAMLLLLALVMLILYPFTVHNLWLMAPCLFFIGFSGSLGLPLQTYLMDVAGDAQTMAAASHHAAFNIANALGPWLASMAIALGWGYAASGYVGALLAACGLVLLLFVAKQGRTQHRTVIQRADRPGGGMIDVVSTP
ncbi:MFS transporter [Brucella sp. NBRC 12950]|uniref:MFS transporter n=1 Tax=Brucella sp. NBRC 12950 TaxID=2994518 RepID=UPI0024A03E80|nr:MFS transporter [Brucella sp. NBRC 12950]GLU27581.1 MFS transporter [Brucella sp. NBRC 12950]